MAQCFVFAVVNRKPGNQGESSCPSADFPVKGYALLPQFFRDEHPEVAEIFSRNGIIVMGSAQDDSSLHTVSKSFSFEMIEINVFSESPESENDSSDASDRVYVDVIDKCNREVVELLFNKNVRVKEIHEDEYYYTRLVDDDLKVMKNLLLFNKNIAYRHFEGGTILHFAVIKGMRFLVKLLLQYEADINAKRSDGKTPLFLAVMREDENQIRLRCLNSLDADSVSNEDSLKDDIYEISLGDEEIVGTLLEHGADASARELDGSTPLHVAAVESYVGIVKSLLQYKADVNAKRCDGMTPLCIAVMKSREEIVGTLLEHGADASATELDGSTPLHLAATNSHAGIVKNLLRYKADINAKRCDGMTPLCIAVMKLRKEVVGTLLEHGADVNIEFDYYCPSEVAKFSVSIPEEQAKRVTKATILYVAALMREVEFIRLILRHQPDVANECNRNAFHFVLLERKYSFKDIFEEMKQYGFTIDYNRFDNSFEFLFGAIHKNCFEVVQKMVEEGFNVNKVYKSRFEKCTPMHMAARHAGADIIKLLLDHRANVNSKLHKRFPIHSAIESNNINAVKYFVSEKINFPDKADLIYAAVAASYGHSEIIEFLLLNGYPLTYKNEYNKAIGLAANLDLIEVMDLLFEYGAELTSEYVNYTKPLYQAFRGGIPEIFQAILDHIFTDVKLVNYTKVFLKLEHDLAFQRDNSLRQYLLCPDMLAQHIVKLEAASLLAFDHNVSSLWRANESIDDFRGRCESEVAEMKSERVGDSQVSFYDFLTQNLSEIAGYARNESVVEAMKADEYSLKFPIYSSVLNRQFKKALQKAELMQQGIKTCKVLFPEKRFHSLPYELKVEVINYLSYRDLLVLNNVLPTDTRSRGSKMTLVEKKLRNYSSKFFSL